MSEKDLLKILVDAELDSGVDKKIEGQLDNIATKYSGMKVQAEIDPNSLKGMESLLKNIEAMGAKMGQASEKAGKSAKQTAEATENSIQSLNKELKNTLKTQNELDRRTGKKKRKTRGNQFKSVTDTVDEEGLLNSKVVENHKAVQDFYNSVMQKAKKLVNLTSDERKELEGVAKEFSKIDQKQDGTPKKGHMMIGSDEHMAKYKQLTDLISDSEQKNKTNGEIYKQIDKITGNIVTKMEKWSSLNEKDLKHMQRMTEAMKNRRTINNNQPLKMNMSELGSEMDKLLNWFGKFESKNKELEIIANKAPSIMKKYSRAIEGMKEDDFNMVSDQQFKELEKQLKGLDKLQTLKGFEDRVERIEQTFYDISKHQEKEGAKLKEMMQHEDLRDRARDNFDEKNIKDSKKNYDEKRKADDKALLNEEKQVVSLYNQARQKQFAYVKQIVKMLGSSKNLLGDEDFEGMHKLIGNMANAKSPDQLKGMVLTIENHFQELVNYNKELNEEMDELFKTEKAREDYISKKRSEREKEETERVERLAKEAKKKSDKIHADREKNIESNASVLDKEEFFFLERLEKLKEDGFINSSEINRVKKLFNTISVETQDVRHELKYVMNELKALEKISSNKMRTSYANSNSREQKDMDMELKRRGFNDRANKIQSGGLGKELKSELQDIHELIALIDHRATKIDLDDVDRELKKIEKAEREIAEGLKEQEQALKEVRKQRKSIASMSEKLSDKLDDTKYRSYRQLGDQQNRDNVSVTYDKIKEEIKELGNLEEEQARERRKQIAQDIKDLNRWIDTYKDVEKAKKEAQSENMRQEKLGNRINPVGFDIQQLRGSSIRENQINIMNNIEDTLKKLHPEIDKFDRDMIKVKRTLNSLGEEVYTVDYQVKRGERQFEDYSLAIDVASNSMRDLGRRMRQLRPEMTAMENFTQAMQKVPIWATASTLFFGIGHQLTQSIETVMEVDHAMTNLHKVADETQSQLRDFRMEASQIGNEMGILAKDVIEATTEFVRLGYALEEAKGLSETALVYANVGDMDVVDASTSLIGALKGFAVAEEDVVMQSKRYIDVFNEVGNNFAISSEGIGEALKRSSATLYQAGNTVEQSVAMITAGNSAIQDPKKVGTALKTISMRLRGVDEEGQKVKGLIPELDKLFKRFGETIVDETGEGFKSTYEMMDILAENWDKLSDMEQAQTIEAIGGKRQGAIVSAIIQNWQDAEKAHNTALGSMGSAQREFEKYMDSMQYKVGRLKNAWQDFWLTFWDDEAMKATIDQLTKMIQSLTKLTETFGAFAPASLLFTAMLLAMSKRAREAVIFGKGMVSVRKALEGLGAVNIKGFIGGLGKIVAFGWRLLKFASIVGVVTFAIEGLIRMWTAESRARQNRIQELKDERVETQKLLDTLDSGTINRYEELTKMSKTGDLNLEERNELKTLIAEMEEVMPNLIEYYDAEGNAHYKTADAIRKEVEARRDRNKEINAEIGKKKIEGYDTKALEDSLGKLEETRKLAGDIGSLDSGSKMIQDWFKNLDKQMVIGSTDYKESFDNVLAEIKSKMSEEEYNDFTMKAMPNLIHGSVSKEEAKAQIDQMANTIDTIKEKTKEAMKDAEIEIEKAGKDLKDAFQDIAISVAEKNNISPESNDQLMLEMITKNFHKGLIEVGATGDEILEYLNGLEGDLVDVLGEVSDKGIDLEELFKNGGTEEQLKLFDELVKTYDGKAEKLLVISAILDTLNQKHQDQKENIEGVNDELKDATVNTERLAQEYSEATGSIGELNRLLKELEDDGKLSAESVGLLISKHEELIPYLNDEEMLIKKIKEARMQLSDVAMDKLRQQLMADNEYINVVAKNNKEFWNWLKEAYEGDLGDFKDLARAKSEVDKQLRNSMASEWSKYYDAEKNTLSEQGRRLQASVNWKMMNDPSYQGDDLKNYEGLMAEYQRIQDGLEESAKQFDGVILDSIDIDFDSIGMGKDNKSKDPDKMGITDAWIRMNQLESENEKIKSERLSVIIKQAKEEGLLNKQLEHTNELLSTQKKNIGELTEANENLHKRANKIRSNTKWDTGNWFDVNGDATTDYIKKYNSLNAEQQDKMKELFSKLQKLKKQYMENVNSIGSLNQAMIDTNMSIKDLKFDIAERKFSRLSQSADMAYSRISDIMSRIDQGFSFLGEDNQEKEIQLLNKKSEALRKQMSIAINSQKQLERLKESMKEYPEIVKEIDEKIKHWKDRQNELDVAIYSNSINMKDIYKELADDVIEHYISQLERQRDKELDVIDDQIKAEDKRHKEKMDNIDEEMDKFDKYINQQIEALDDQKNKDDFEKQLRKLNQQKQKIQSQLDAYAMDDSLEGNAKRKELEEEMAKVEEEIQEHSDERKLQQRKDSLQDQLDEKKDQIDEEKKLEDKAFQQEKERLDKEREELNKSYENRIADEQRWLSIREDIYNGNIESITGKMEGFITEVSDGMTDLNNNIKQNLIDSLQKTIKLMKQVKEQNPNGYVEPTASNGGSLADEEFDDVMGTGTSVLGENDYKLMGAKFLYDEMLPYATDDNQRNGLRTRAEDWSEQAISMGVGLDSNSSFDQLLGGMSEKEKLATAKYISEYVIPDIQTVALKDEMRNLVKKMAEEARRVLGEDFWQDKNFLQSLESFDTGGYTGTFNNGRLAVLHEKELILNKVDTSNILDTVKVVRDLAKMLPMIKLPSFNVDSKSDASGDTYIDVTFRIDKVTGGEEGAKELMKRFNNGLKRKGVKI